MGTSKARVLVVDDEPRVVEGLRLVLGRKVDVVTALSGAEALEKLAAEVQRPFAILISDMRMPSMNGAALLSRARELYPDMVRVLLTGQADLESAMAAVNQGQIFRFLTKPCPSEQLLQVVETALKQFDLVRAEKVLLEQTLKGAINMLTDVLSAVSPKAFGQAISIREHSAALASKLGAEERWAIEIAAVLSQVSMMTLPERLAEKVYRGDGMTHEEQQMVAQLPRITDQLLANIPRMELVRGMLANVGKRFDELKKPQEPEAVGGQIIDVAIDFNMLELRGLSLELALETMLGRKGRYDPRVVQGLCDLHGGAQILTEVMELPLLRLRQGMVLADQVRTKPGNVLCAPGTVLSPTLIERLHNFAKSVGVREPIRVVIKNRMPLPMGVLEQRSL